MRLDPAFASLEEAAAFLGISRSSAYRLAERGQLPVRAVRVGRRWVVAVAALERFAAESAEPVVPVAPRRLRAVR